MSKQALPFDARGSDRRRRIAILQSNYVPWKGYFDLIDHVDEFVVMDDVQYTRRDWRNRNRIKTPHGTRWLTIPIMSKGRFEQRINQVEIADPSWARSHWKAIESAYGRQPGFDVTAETLAPLYKRLSDHALLSDSNYLLLRAVCDLLSIKTPLTSAAEYPHRASRNGRLLDICLAAGASEYVSGPAAKSYLDIDRFTDAGVAVSWFDYSGYREYPQPHGPFEHAVSIVDLLCCTGRDSRSYVKR